MALWLFTIIQDRGALDAIVGWLAFLYNSARPSVFAVRCSEWRHKAFCTR